MNLVKIVCKCYMLFVGLFFIIISLDAFEYTLYPFKENLASFLLHALPGFILIAIAIMIWKFEFWLGVIAFGFALSFFLFAKAYDQFITQYSLVLMVEVPMVLAGAILVLWGVKPRKQSDFK